MSTDAAVTRRESGLQVHALIGRPSPAKAQNDEFYWQLDALQQIIQKIIQMIEISTRIEPSPAIPGLNAFDALRAIDFAPSNASSNEFSNHSETHKAHFI